MKGQSLEVSSDLVTGELRNSLILIWSVNKLEKTDKIQASLLVLGNSTTGEILFTGINPIIESPSVKSDFAGRLTAAWDGTNFKVKLTKLLYSDSVAFTYIVSQIANDNVTPRGGMLFKTITITEVRGMLIL